MNTKAKYTEDEIRLRERVLEEIHEIMRREDIGGVVMLVSRDTAAWRVMLPSWAGLVFESKGLRLRINSKTPESRAVADSTMGLIGTIRDISNDTHSLFGRLFRQAKYVLEQQGAELVHPPMPASERPDPKTGEHE